MNTEYSLKDQFEDAFLSACYKTYGKFIDKLRDGIPHWKAQEWLMEILDRDLIHPNSKVHPYEVAQMEYMNHKFIERMIREEAPAFAKLIP